MEFQKVLAVPTVIYGNNVTMRSEQNIFLINDKTEEDKTKRIRNDRKQIVKEDNELSTDRRKRFGQTSQEMP